MNCTFINNTAPQGGAIFGQGGANGFIYNSIFINNTATSGGGGAIMLAGGPTLSLNFCVFINNTATVSPQIITLSGTDGVVNLDYNYWGSNNLAGKIASRSSDDTLFVGLDYYYITIFEGFNQVSPGVYSYTYFLALNGHTIPDSDASNLPDFMATIIHPDGTSEEFNAKKEHTWTYAPSSNSMQVQVLMGGDIIGFENEEKIDTLFTQIVVSTSTAYNNTQVNLTATLLKADGTPLGAGQTVRFFVNNVFVGNATTNDNGIATFEYVVKEGIGSFVVNATFDGSEGYFASSNFGTLNVVEEPNTTDNSQTIPNESQTVPDEDDLDHEDDSDIFGENSNDDETYNYSASAAMKKTGIPLLIVLLVLLSIIGLVGRKQ